MAQKFASDQDAGDLLADILDETEADARAEAERLEAMRNAKQREELLARQQEEAAKNEEVSKRLEEERRRLEEAERRRYDRLSEKEIELLKAEGKYLDPRAEEKARAEEEARIRAEEEQRRKEDLKRMEAEKIALQEKMRQQAAEADAKVKAAQKTHRRNMILATAAIVLILAGGGIGALIYSMQYSPDKTVYSKTNYKPQEVMLARVDVSFTPMPKPIIKQQDDDNDDNAKKGRRRRPSRGRAAPKKKSDAGKVAADFDKMFNSGGDIFKSGL